MTKSDGPMLSSFLTVASLSDRIPCRLTSLRNRARGRWRVLPAARLWDSLRSLFLHFS
jgi:hypothetical protein